MRNPSHASRIGRRALALASRIAVAAALVVASRAVADTVTVAPPSSVTAASTTNTAIRLVPPDLRGPVVISPMADRCSSGEQGWWSGYWTYNSSTRTWKWTWVWHWCPGWQQS